MTVRSSLGRFLGLHRWSRWDSAILVGAVAFLAGAALPLPGYSVAPGSADDVRQAIHVGGSEVYPPEGRILVTTVALHPLSPLRALQAWLDPDIKVVPQESVVPDEDRRQDMEVSRQAAVAVALHHLGPLVDTEDPPSVRIEPGDIDGDSAGLAFALGILDLLSPGELTGANTVAASGTIEIDGTVGDVGSVAQKAVAAREAGADYFLVPAQRLDEALAHAGGAMTVVPVATLDDAIAALGRIGGDVSALAPSSGTR